MQESQLGRCLEKCKLQVLAICPKPTRLLAICFPLHPLLYPDEIALFADLPWAKSTRLAVACIEGKVNRRDGHRICV
jgi:hypothetical protein